MAHRIYLAQHGLAVDKYEDPDRPLSLAGIQHSKVIATHLNDAGIDISKVLHSGKLRAAQTAEIFAEVMNLPATVTSDGLAPNDDVELLAHNLSIDNALYIGHLPHLEKLVTYLVTGNKNDNVITFQNSAITCLQQHDAHYQLQWYLTPSLLTSHFQQA